MKKRELKLEEKIEVASIEKKPALLLICLCSFQFYRDLA